MLFLMNGASPLPKFKLIMMCLPTVSGRAFRRRSIGWPSVISFQHQEGSILYFSLMCSGSCKLSYPDTAQPAKVKVELYITVQSSCRERSGM